MVGITRKPTLSEILIDADLNMGAHNIVLDMSQTVDGRDVGADGNKLDGVETGAQVGKIVEGTYVGDGSTGLAIDTGLTTLKGVLVHRASQHGAVYFRQVNSAAGMCCDVGNDTRVADKVTGISGGSFTVDDAGADAIPNSNGVTYAYIAWGN